MTKKAITLLLILLPIILITACQQQTPVSSEQKASVESNEETIIQSDSGTEIQEQDNEKKILTLEDSVIANGCVKKALQNTLLFEDGRLYFAEINEKTKEPALFLIAENVKQIGTQPGTFDSPPNYQTKDGKIDHKLESDFYCDKPMTLLGNNIIKLEDGSTRVAPWSLLYNCFPETLRDELGFVGNKLKDAQECQVRLTPYFSYFYIDQHDTLKYYRIYDSEPPYKGKEDLTTIQQDVSKFQADYFSGYAGTLQVTYLSNYTLYVDDCFLSKENRIRIIRDVTDFWRGPNDSVIYQEKNGNVYIYWPDRDLQDLDRCTYSTYLKYNFSPVESVIKNFPNIKLTEKIKDFFYFYSKSGIRDFKYAYVDMDGKIHYSSDTQPEKFTEPIALAEPQTQYKTMAEDYVIDKDDNLYQIAFESDAFQSVKVLENVKCIVPRHTRKQQLHSTTKNKGYFDVITQNGDAYQIGERTICPIIELNLVASGMDNIKKIFKGNLVLTEDDTLWNLTLIDKESKNYPVSSDDYSWIKVINDVEYASWAGADHIVVKTKNQDLLLIDQEDIGSIEQYKLIDNNVKGVDVDTNFENSECLIVYIDQNGILKKCTPKEGEGIEDYSFETVDENVQQVMCTNWPIPAILFQLIDGQWIYLTNNDTSTKQIINLDKAQQYFFYSGSTPQNQQMEYHQYQIVLSVDAKGQLYNKTLYSDVKSLVDVNY